VPHGGHDQPQGDAQYHQVRHHLDRHQDPCGRRNRHYVAETDRGEHRDREVQGVRPGQTGVERPRPVLAEDVVDVGEQEQEQRHDQGQRLDSLQGGERRAEDHPHLADDEQDHDGEAAGEGGHGPGVQPLIDG